MRRQLRAIDGPLTGAVFVLEKRTRIGRAGESDIQIIHDGVSRQHAQLVQTKDGGHELVDLASNNGTFVDGQKIERRRLEPGQEVRIVSATFVYEEAPEEAPIEADEVYAVKVTSGRTLRRTMSVMDIEMPRPRQDTPPKATPAPELAAQKRERLAVVALQPDGTEYDGEIIADILEFRDLRIRSVRREKLDAVATRRFSQLEETFSQSPGEADPVAKRRRFCRFRVAFPARLRHGEQAAETTIPVMVVDLSAGGARVASTRHGLDVGALAWLVIDLEIGGRSRTHVLTSRVARVYGPDHLGVIFAGAPEWDTWSPDLDQPH